MHFEINTIEDLCTYINVYPNFLRYVLFVKKNKYKPFLIPKKDGNYRCIDAPCDELKYIQRQLLKFLENNYKFLDYQHGFIKGKSCVSNAKCHINKRFVLNGDIKDFFNQIHFGRVRGLFMNQPFNYSNRVATIIAKIVCYDKKLPQGAPTSPIISNMICYTMDKQLNYIAKRNNCKYTRYADDITFSTDAETFPKEIAELKGDKIYFSEKIVKIVNGGYPKGFEFNSNKTKLYKRYVRQEVTGIVVNKKTNVNSEYIKNIRAILHNITVKGFIDSYEKTFNIKIKNEESAKRKLFNFLAGKISYLKMVKGDTDNLYIKYAGEFNKAFKTKTFDITEEVRIQKYASKRCYVIECGLSYGSGFSIEKDQVCTSTHVLLNDMNFPSFIHSKENHKYDEQFPIIGDRIPLTNIKHQDLKNDKYIFDYKITKEDYENDIISLPVSINNKNKLTVARKRVQLGETVYMTGYPAFNGFDNSPLHIIKTKVIGENTFFDRKLINTDKSPKHGMSGGPVFNTSKEVVGIVYAGFDDESDENVGFISLI